MESTKVERNVKNYLKLFASTFYLSAFTFGGGYVIVPLMKEKFVDEMGWIDEEEMLNLVVIAQSSPGALAVNASMLVGYQVGGVLGALVSILGTILPPLIIISIVSLVYDAFRANPVVNAVLKGMESGVAAVVAYVVIGMGKPFFKNRQWVYILVMLVAFLVSLFTELNVAFIILGCGLFGALYTLWNNRKGAQ